MKDREREPEASGYRPSSRRPNLGEAPSLSRLMQILECVARDPDTECWEWAGSRGGNGRYGRAKWGGRATFVHRVTYTTFVGPIPAGLEIDHLCRNRWCVNPAHLEAVTHLENVRRGNVGWNSRIKTHCPHGHPYDEENTWVRTGGRHCRECHRARRRENQRLDRERRRAAA